MRNVYVTSFTFVESISDGRYRYLSSAREFGSIARYRIDIVVEDAVILELKCVEHVLPVHEAQLLTYLKLTGKRVGLILNFHFATLVRGGIVRRVI
jgi:GxxExxY protein